MPLLADIGLVAKAAGSFGADTLAVANAYPSMKIGFSGENNAWQPRRRALWPDDHVHYSPLGLGGHEGGEHPHRWITGGETVEDVLFYMSVGDSVVQGRTASFAGPGASEAIIESLGALVRTINHNSINKLG
jgi:hypothetical protein